MHESQNIEQATADIQTAAPDSKTRRYDRQLRLWAASGQAALESARILVASGSATATAVLKNLVLPGIGHFTVLDPAPVSPADAGNNFFLNAHASIGKPRASEAVPLLRELNDSVDGVADTRDLAAIVATDDGRAWIASFTLVITHNLPPSTLAALADLLWADPAHPPLIAVRSAGFLADIYIQLHDHCIIESHSDITPSLRLTRPFPALQRWADSLDYDDLDPTDHAHIPFVVILVKEADRWRKQHDGHLPRTYAEQKAFKAQVIARRKKHDEENFEEAEAQAVRLWSEKPVNPEVAPLLAAAADTTPASLARLPPHTQPFHALLATLARFVNDPASPAAGALPLTTTLPDMRTDTASYVKTQNLYKAQAALESAHFKHLLAATFPDLAPSLDPALVDAFIKNAHHIQRLRGRRLGDWETDKAAVAAALAADPKPTATHLALSALSALLGRGLDEASITPDALRAEIDLDAASLSDDAQDALDDALGELARAPTADTPNTAALLGGLVAQEAIKLVTRQYVPTNGWCVVDLVGSWTGLVGVPPNA